MSAASLGIIQTAIAKGTPYIDLEDGLVHCISKGLYEEGVSFRINTVTFKT
jgi:hypothetical protein